MKEYKRETIKAYEHMAIMGEALEAQNVRL